MFRKIAFVIVALLLILAGASTESRLIQAQGDGCGDAPPPRLTVGGRGQVTFTDGLPLNVRDAATLNGARVGQLPEGAPFAVLDGPVCADGINWWRVQAELLAGWVAEGLDGEYFIEPITPEPTVPPDALSSQASPSFAAVDWAAFVPDYYSSIPDPATITPPPVYAGDMPAVPVDLTNALFVDDAALNAAQSALLAQNGFVVVPGGFEQFDDAYAWSDTWDIVPPDFSYEVEFDPLTDDLGHAYFVTTDSMLWALHYIFDNLLTDLERDAFMPLAVGTVRASLEAAREQSAALTGTALATAATNAELYLAIGLELLSPGDMESMVSGAVAADAMTVVDLALAGEGQEPLPFLAGYREDFSQYRPRGHYAGDPDLERYFRGMMWLSRITFRASETAEVQTALLLLRALLTAQSDTFALWHGITDLPTAFSAWERLHDTLTFLIGPVDDLGPPEYGPLAEFIFGPDADPLRFADAGLLAAFQAGVEALPGPRINGLILPADTTAAEVEELTRGFRFLGQRFTYDGYLMQQLMSPYVGTREQPRRLPLSVDIPAALGSDLALGLAVEAGASEFANYDSQMAALRAESAALTDADYLENFYGGWLWALLPLWTREAAPYPPFMQTEAWRLHELHTGLASWTTLKHDTVLYIKQPTGFGGGGPPLTSFGYVEPNPLVFARISIIAATLYEGIDQRGLDELGLPAMGDTGGGPLLAPARGTSRQMPGPVDVDMEELRTLAVRAARLADMAQRELAGEPLTEDDYWSILGIGGYLQVLLQTLWQGEGPPDPVALVTDVANDGVALTLQEAVGAVDYIYVVVPAPGDRLQVARGGVFSYYEFVGNINERMTDDEWRAQVASGDLPPRPAWTAAFFAE